MGVCSYGPSSLQQEPDLGRHDLHRVMEEFYEARVS